MNILQLNIYYLKKKNCKKKKEEELLMNFPKEMNEKEL